jgi:hypothetical protein
MERAMTKAEPKVSGTDEKRKELDVAILDLAHELHDLVTETHALLDAVSAIAAMTELTERSLARLRHVVVSVQAAAGEALGLSADLGQALRVREVPRG